MEKFQISEETHKELYYDTDKCLEFLKNYDFSKHKFEGHVDFHMFWSGKFGRKQAFAIKSYLVTQNIDKTTLNLWLDKENGWKDHAKNEYLKPLMSHIKIRCYDPEIESSGSIFEGKEFFNNDYAVFRSDIFRYLILWKYGGIWVDFDIMFLRDISSLFKTQFLYKWANRDTYNIALMNIFKDSELSNYLMRLVNKYYTKLDIEMKKNNTHNVITCCIEMLKNLNVEEKNALTLPCSFFDPVWLDVDGICKSNLIPFRKFNDFFKKTDKKISYKDFCKGAFAYHWHNQWKIEEEEGSYFDQFDKEFDEILKIKLNRG